MKQEVNFSTTISKHRWVRQVTRFGIQCHEPPAMCFPTVAIDVRELQLSEDRDGEVGVRETGQNWFSTEKMVGAAQHS